MIPIRALQWLSMTGYSRGLGRGFERRQSRCDLEALVASVERGYASAKFSERACIYSERSMPRGSPFHHLAPGSLRVRG